MELYELTQMLPKDIDGGIIESPASRQYFTGFTADSGYLIASNAYVKIFPIFIYHFLAYGIIFNIAFIGHIFQI